MKRFLPFASLACFALMAGCGDGTDPTNPNNPNPSDVPSLPERDGLPSTGNASRLLYYISTHEDAPGLYAVQPSEPTAAPTYIDPEINLVRPFFHTVHGGNLEAGAKISDFHVAGVFYKSYFTPESGPFADMGDTFAGRSFLALTSPSQADTPPRQITNDEHGGAHHAGVGGIFSYNLDDVTRSSFLTYGVEGPIRYDFDQLDNEPAKALPEGRALISYVGENTAEHEHWLYANEDHELVFFNRAFTASTPVVDEDTGDPLDDISEWSVAVGALNAEDHLFVLATNEQSNSDQYVGTLYRVSRPSAAYPGGSAKVLRNANGEALVLGVGPFVLGRGAPSVPLFYVRDNTAYFAVGAGLFSAIWSTLTRADRDGWTEFDHKQALLDEGKSADMPMMQSQLPPVFIEVPDHGTFWAPGGKAELIEATEANGQAWKRTPLDAPQPESTTIFSSANGWVFYNYSDNRNGAVAYHVPSKKSLQFQGAQWLGASSNGNSSTIGSVALTEIADVFLLLRDRRLVALEAAHPDKGMVVLGTIPASADVHMFGLGRGPYRLLQLIDEDAGSAEVVYVDTSRKNSLRHLMSEPAVNWDRPSISFGMSTEDRVDYRGTRPVELF